MVWDQTSLDSNLNQQSGCSSLAQQRMPAGVQTILALVGRPQQTRVLVILTVQNLLQAATSPAGAAAISSWASVFKRRLDRSERDVARSLHAAHERLAAWSTLTTLKAR